MGSDETFYLNRFTFFLLKIIGDRPRLISNKRGLSLITHIDEDVIDDIRASTNGNYVLGNERFKDQIADVLKRRVVPGKAGRPVKLD